jgi:hypothetical protein
MGIKSSRFNSWFMIVKWNILLLMSSEYKRGATKCLQQQKFEAEWTTKDVRWNLSLCIASATGAVRNAKCRHLAMSPKLHERGSWLRLHLNDPLPVLNGVKHKAGHNCRFFTCSSCCTVLCIWWTQNGTNSSQGSMSVRRCVVCWAKYSTN